MYVNSIKYYEIFENLFFLFTSFFLFHDGDVREDIDVAVMLRVFILNIFILWQWVQIGHFRLTLRGNLRHFRKSSRLLYCMSAQLDVPKTAFSSAGLSHALM